jgi:alanine racemase
MAFIKINKQNFYHNLNQIALQTGSVEKIAIVLKDNAYGHGLELMAKLASKFGITHAVVRKTSEAKQIKSLFKNILILGDNIIKEENYSYAINTIEDIKKAQKGAKVELKVDTGMHRNGVALEDLELALDLVREQGLDLVGVMTHYREADELSSALFWQQKNFEKVKKIVQKQAFPNVRFHSCNSASILRMHHFYEDLVRVGIGAYGYNELPLPFDKLALKPVLSLHAKKVSSRVLKKGERVGYGGDFMAMKEMTVSTYDLGYGDGWTRAAYVTSENLAILGRVSMDFITLQSNKEEVCVMSNAQNAAKQFGTISYEITTALMEKLEKIVV